MKIGIIGAGTIGATLVQRLSASGHEVKVANSRGPETIDSATFSAGGRAVQASEVGIDVDVLIVSVPLCRVPAVAPLVQQAPAEAVIIDTSNYYPMRDGRIAQLEDGQVESLWVSEQYGRPVAKAWNAITSQSFRDKATDAGAGNRIAIPVAADDDRVKTSTMALVEETGFDAVDAGSLADSWRQQPGTPAYCTDYTKAELPGILALADAARSARRRDLAITAMNERREAEGSVGADYLVRLNRAIYGPVPAEAATCRTLPKETGLLTDDHLWRQLASCRGTAEQ